MKPEYIHLGHKLDPATLEAIADIICGDNVGPTYRSSMYLTKFFHDAGINAEHDGTTRKWWVLGVLGSLSPQDTEKVVLRLADLKEYKGQQEQLKIAVEALNSALCMDNYKIGYIKSRPVLKMIDEVELEDALFERDNTSNEEEQFLSKNYSDDIKLEKLNLDAIVAEIINERVTEIKKCLSSNASLGSIFLIGSTLEGILLNCALRHKDAFTEYEKAPKTANGKVKNIHDWRLAELIDVSYALNFIDLDVRKFSHVLRDFRNYIHPYSQVASKFSPDNNTAQICWQVFKATVDDLSRST